MIKYQHTERQLFANQVYGQQSSIINLSKHLYKSRKSSFLSDQSYLEDKTMIQHEKDKSLKTDHTIDFDVDLMKHLRNFKKKTNVHVQIAKELDPLALKLRPKRQLMKKSQLRQRTTRYSFDSDESDFELPKAQQHIRKELQDNEYLKLYQMMNPMHDADREKATSLAMNIKYNDQVAKESPFFNKKEEEDQEIPYLDKHIKEWG